MTTFCRAPLCHSFATTLVVPSSAAAAAASSSPVLQHRARNWAVLLSPVFRIKSSCCRLERRRRLNIVRSTLDSTGTPGGGDSGSTDSSRINLGSTRIGRLVSGRRQELLKSWRIGCAYRGHRLLDVSYASVSWRQGEDGG
ncbi:hypothetical protein CY35_09G084300 [Sphagnum magellanicum]|nr:hypothetical protein CY35_09G084300 [Sphagnum magellanicum]